MVRLRFDLDALYEYESPSSKYDIGGLHHYIVIEEENKEAFLDEIAKHYQEIFEELLEIEEDEEE
jgi:hypothetical protein